MFIRSIYILLCSLLTMANSYCQVSLDSAIVIEELTVYFDSDQYELHQTSIQKIHALCVKMDSIDRLRFYLDAHTDAVGSAEYNLKLSDKRRNSVEQELIRNGIADSLIQTEHFGEQATIKKGVKSEDNKLNRRARIRVTQEKEFIYLKGRVIDSGDGTGLNAEINITSDDFENSTRSDSSGRFRILSPLYAKVNLEVLALNYFIETNTLMISDKHRSLELKVPLPKLELGKRYQFKNMLFEGNRSVMIPGSERAADHLKRFMFLNNDVCIEISGHVNFPSPNDVSPKSGYFELSVARASEIKNLMLNEGVLEQRMLAKGYGNWQMKFPHPKTEAEMGMNRRVEIGILDCRKSASIADDQIPDVSRYQKFHAHRLYVHRLMDYDLRMLGSAKIVRQQVEVMVENGMDPSKYSYSEIITAHPDLPEKK